MNDGAATYRAAFADGIRPARPLTLSDWACQHRLLSREASAEPGPYRIERTPYLREVSDALGPDSPWSSIVFLKSSQIGGSEVGNNWVGYVMDRAPGPMMMVQPTIEIAEDYSKQRIAPMLRDCPVLAEKVLPSKSRDAGNTIRQKYFPGGMLVMAGANSAASLASKPIRYLFLDEIDRYPLDVDGEGCPVELAKKRTATFSRRKVFLNSTPTIKGVSKIEAAYDASTRGRYHVPCPHCQHEQVLKWDGIRWDKESDGRPILASVHYVCASCGEKIGEHSKTEMLRRGRWIHEDPTAATLGFHINALYSPVGWFSWAMAVEQWHDAQKDPAKLKAFINTVLGETYELRGEDTPQWHVVYARREAYSMTELPRRVVLLTAGVDVQKDRLEVGLIGWSGKEAWLCDHIVIAGETALPIDQGPWAELTELLQRQWPRASGGFLAIERLAIDTGFNTSRVYEWARAQQTRIVLPIKGVDSQPVQVGPPKVVDYRATDGKRILRGLRYYPVGVSVLKGEIMSRFKIPVPSLEQVKARGYPANYLHVPEVSEEFCRQLTAESEVIKKKKNGQEVREWHKAYARNEGLDIVVYGFAAFYQMGAHRWTADKWASRGALHDVREDRPREARPAETRVPEPLPAAAPKAPPPPPPTPAKEAAPPVRRKRQSSYWG